MENIQDFELNGSPSLTFLDIAEKCLYAVKKPLSAREIVALALKEGMLHSAGKTPWQTMKSKLSTDILAKGSDSRFKRVYEGLFALREADEKEYFAVRYKKNKLDEDIAVIAAANLHKIIGGPGLWIKPIDRSKLTNLSKSMLRREAEETYDVIQLVSVFLVRYQDKFLTHMRSARLPENRLHGEYSLMLGGHISVEDFAQLTLDLFSHEDELSDCTYILRELSEELILKNSPKVEPCGYLYDDSREVSKQHLGMVYLVNLKDETFEIGERGFLLNAQMESVDQIKNRRDQFENWSWILMDNIEKIYKNGNRN